MSAISLLSRRPGRTSILALCVSILLCIEPISSLAAGNAPEPASVQAPQAHQDAELGEGQEGDILDAPIPDQGKGGKDAPGKDGVPSIPEDTKEPPTDMRDEGLSGISPQDTMTPRPANWPSLRMLITSPFGAIRGMRRHAGVDIRAHLGWPIRALRGGTVVKAGPRGAAGIAVEIRQDDGKTAVYCHMSEALVSEGAKVAKGQHIGIVGCTGRTTGAHLHLAMRDKSGGLIDPVGEIAGPWELFDPPAKDIKERIEGQACTGSFLPYSPAGGGMAPPYLSGRGGRRFVANPRLRGNQQYLRMRRALSGINNFRVPDRIESWGSPHR